MNRRNLFEARRQRFKKNWIYRESLSYLFTKLNLEFRLFYATQSF